MFIYFADSLSAANNLCKVFKYLAALAARQKASLLVLQQKAKSWQHFWLPDSRESF